VEDGMIRVTSGFIGEQFDGSVTMAFRSRGVNSSVDFAVVNATVDGTNGLAAATNLASMTYKAKPTVYALSPNYPNPFNPTTTIEYSIPASGNVELAIYNAAGQKVRTLVSEHQSASFYKAVWDGRNDMGESVGSGIYFSRLVSGNFSKIQKMTLIK
jgi:flagellar hook assembly protein FlgD